MHLSNALRIYPQCKRWKLSPFCIRSVEKDGSCHHSNQEKSFKIRERHYIYGIFLICRLNLQPNIQPSNADFHLPFNQDTWDWNLCWGMRKKFCVQKHESVGCDYIADCCDIRLPFNKLHRKSTKKTPNQCRSHQPLCKAAKKHKLATLKHLMAGHENK